MTPLVTIFIPVYNAEKYLAQTLDSVLAQTYTQLDILLINDGSTDTSVQIIKQYQARDKRIRLEHNPGNKGVAYTRNQGLALAQGEYLAFLDADDLSLPTRIEKQVAFLEKNPAVGLCGSWIKTIGERANEIWRQPLNPAEIKCTLLFNGTFCHSSIMVRLPLIKKYALGFNPAHTHREDWGFWIACSEHFPLGNLKDILVHYRFHRASTSRQQKDAVLACEYLIDTENLAKLGLQPTPTEAVINRSLEHDDLVVPKTLTYVRDVSIWLYKLHTANTNKKRYPTPMFQLILIHYWIHVCSCTLKLWLKGILWIHS